MKVDANKVVAIHYRVSTEGGEPRDASDPGEPLYYLHGAGEVVPGLEEALNGKQAGDAIRVTLSPEQGYGEHDPALDIKVPLSSFPGDMV